MLRAESSFLRSGKVRDLYRIDDERLLLVASDRISAYDVVLPPGLRESDRLPEPIFTPAWKAPQGQHDQNIPFARVATLVGRDHATRIRDASLALYRRGAEVCERAGIMLADTKFEFGVLPSG